MKKVLVIEDDADILFLIETILKESYEVITSMTSAIVSRIGEINPNLIILDNWLPGMTGSEICKTLKAQSDTKHIPVIMVSADSCLARVVKDCGAEDYLNKPFNISVLLSKIKKYTS